MTVTLRHPALSRLAKGWETGARICCWWKKILDKYFLRIQCENSNHELRKKTAYTLTTGFHPKQIVFSVVRDVTL